MADSQSGQAGGARAGPRPVLILDDDAVRTEGRDAQSMIIAAGLAVAEAVRTTLGPKGMDKMLVDDIGDVIITNDGVTILDEMDVEHPAAKLVIEVAETQEEEVGDGTTTAAVLTGALLLEADELLDMDLHPRTITAGYEQAAEKAIEHLNSITMEVSADDEDQLSKVAQTALTGKNLAGSLEALGDLAVRTVQTIATSEGVDPRDFEIMAEPGAPMDDSELIEGVIVDKDRVHVNMPTRVKDAKIALLETELRPELETDATNYTTHTNFDSAADAQSVQDREHAILREMVAEIAESGANVLFCEEGIADYAQHLLVQEDILAVRQVKSRHMRRLAKATGGELVSDADDITPETIGHAGLVEERTVGTKDWVFVEDPANGGTAVPLVRGGTDVVVEDVERALDDAIDVVASAVDDGKILAGGGAPEIDVALALREFAETVGSREQLAVNAFADAIETIPRTLASNAGQDPIDALVNLRRHHDDGDPHAGLNLATGEIVNTADAGVIEPFSVKQRAIESGQEAATMLLRIDDFVSPPMEAIQEEDDIPAPPGGQYGPPAYPR